LTDVSGKPIGPILKGQKIQEIEEILDFVTLEDGITITGDVMSQKSATLIQIEAEGCNHA